MKKQKSIKFNFIMNAILSVSNILFPLITFPYLINVLKPDGTGKIATAVSVIEYFNLFAQLGIPTYGVRACAQVRDDREKLTKTAHELLFISLFTSFITYIVFAVCVMTVPILRDDKLLFVVMSSSILLTSIGMEWLYKALEEYRYITIRSIIFKFISLIALFILVRKQEDYVFYGAISVFASTGSMILNFITVGRHIDMKPRKDYDFKRHFKAVGIFFAMGCATTVYTNLDTIMLRVMTTETDTGYYYASVRIKWVVLSIITSLGAVLLPRVSYYVENGMMEEFKKVITKALKFVVIVSLPASMFFILTAKPCLMLLSHEEFAGAIVPMQVIIPTVFLIGISNLLGIQTLIPLKKEKALLFFLIGGALIDFVLNLIFIPGYRSTGASYGTLMAELFVTTGLWVYLYGDLKDVYKNLEILRILGAIVVAFSICILSYVGADYIVSRGLIPFASGYNRVACSVRIFLPFVVFCVVYILILFVFKEKLTIEVLNRFFRKGTKK